MFFKIKKKLIELINFLHRIIFGHEMSLEMKKFIKNLSWSFLGIFFNGLILFAVNILAGRIIGPEGYGRYNLVLVIANIFAAFILFGLNITSVKYISSSTDDNEKKQYLSNSFFIVSFTSVVVLLFLFFMNIKLTKIFNLDKDVFLFGVLLAVVLSWRSLLDSFIKSFELFRYQSSVKIIEGFIVIASFLILFFVINFSNYKYYIFSLFLGYSVLCVLYFFKIKNKIIHWKYQNFKKILKYSKSTVILTFIGILMASMDKLFIGKFVGLEKLGIYSAYLMSTSIFVGQICLVFDNVFFPMINKIEKKDEIIKKIDKLFFVFFVPGVSIIFSFSSLIMIMFGREFQFSYLYVLIFSVLAFFQITGTFYKGIVSSAEKSYIKLQKLSYILPVTLFILYSLISFFNKNDLIYYVFAYAVYLTLNLIIIRKSFIKW